MAAIFIAKYWLSERKKPYIQRLEETPRNARQWRFEPKSERFHGEQLVLLDEDIEADADASLACYPVSSTDVRPAAHHGGTYASLVVC